MRHVRAIALLAVMVAVITARQATIIPASAAALFEDFTSIGSVRDKDNRPLAGVRVIGNRHNQGGGYESVSVETASDGRFTIERVGKVLTFRKTGCRQQTVVRNETEKPLVIELEPAAASEWTVQTCENQDGRRHGYLWRFLVPHGVRVKRTNGVDSWAVDIPYPKDKKQRMRIWSLPQGGAYLVWESFLLDSQSFSERSVAGGATDMRGKDLQGRNWRWFGGGFDEARYWGVSDEAAHFFDQIIDSVCLGRR